ncbi:MAG: helix-turn-helix transcriptional regulator [Clostridiales bacterium]|nr:helix-turn-helix transcriptional regulator [Clostridiales bacterium]
MEKMFYVMERIFRMTHIPIHYFDKTGEITLFCLGFEKANDPLIADLVLRKHLLEKVNTADKTALDFEDTVLYGLCMDPYGNYIVLGPVLRGKSSDSILQEYAKAHGLSAQTLHLRTKTLNQMCATLSMMHYEASGEYITEKDIIYSKKDREIGNLKGKNAYQAYELEYTEREEHRYNFSDEQAYMNMIRTGNVEGIKALSAVGLDSFDDYSVGNLAQKAFKQHEYIACSLIVLASRAAIDGGMDSLTAYLMSDLYFTRLEMCNEITDILKLIMSVLTDYTECVKLKNEERSQTSLVGQCKNYIDRHLNKPITVEALAKEIGVERSYLSKRFSQAEGIGIQAYIRNKRVAAAANMLKFSEESILTISNYFYFASQSHFGKVFKDIMGETPQKYRDNNKMIDF